MIMFNKDTLEVLFGISLSLAMTIWFVYFSVKFMFIVAIIPLVIFEIVRVCRDRWYWRREREKRRQKQ